MTYFLVSSTFGDVSLRLCIIWEKEESIYRKYPNLAHASYFSGNLEEEKVLELC